MIIFVAQILIAIHNKDYSVVKTFKAGFAARFFLCEIFCIFVVNYDKSNSRMIQIIK